MSISNTLQEAGRMMAICNACRYCEGFCAVFPAMELRRTFTAEDLKYLANLCHNCRGCYYACQYAPPHEFNLNFPKIMAELRQETYEEFTWPKMFKGLFRNNGLAATLVTLFGVLAVFFTVVVYRGMPSIFGEFTGPGSFYQVIPYLAMLLPFMVLGALVLASLLVGIGTMWRETGGKPEELFDLKAHFRAIGDACKLRYLDGGGHGCNYPDDRFRFIRRTFHHCIFYGFLLCLASTTIAAIYDHGLHLPAPYPLLSWPVVLGTLGGVAIVIGTCGMLYLRTKMDKVPAGSGSFGMDVSFTVLLLLTSLSGLLLLIFRETAGMGSLLVVHLGLVLGFFLTMPYGKFLHVIYRYAALVRNAIEQSRDELTKH